MTPKSRKVKTSNENNHLIYLSDHLINIGVEKYGPSAFQCRVARIFPSPGCKDPSYGMKKFESSQDPIKTSFEAVDTILESSNIILLHKKFWVSLWIPLYMISSRDVVGSGQNGPGRLVGSRHLIFTRRSTYIYPTIRLWTRHGGSGRESHNTI